MSESTSSRPGIGRSLLLWVAGSLLSLFILALLVRGGLLESATEHYVRGPLTEALEAVAFSLPAGVGHMLLFSLGWLEDDSERGHHPVLIGAFNSGLTLVGFLLLALVVSDEANSLAIILGLILLSLIGTIVTARIAVPLPPTHRRSWWVLGAGILSIAVAVAVCPRSLDLPSEAMAEERHQWAQEEVGEPYISIAERLETCAPLKERLGGELVVAPASDGRFEINQDGGIDRVRIDLFVSGRDESGICNFNAGVPRDTDGLGPGEDVVAHCKFDGGDFQIPRNCDCGACEWDCEDPSFVLTPAVEVIPVNLPRFLVADRAQGCDRDGPVCDLSESTTGEISLTRLDEAEADVPVEVEMIEPLAGYRSVEMELVEGGRYRLGWHETRCGPKQFDFTVGPAVSRDLSMKVVPQEKPNEVRVEVGSAPIWKEVSFYVWRGEDPPEGQMPESGPVHVSEVVELDCPSPGPQRERLTIRTMYDQEMTTTMEYDYECE